MKQSLRRLTAAHPHLWYQLYWVVYLVWFFTLDNVIKSGTLIHCALDDRIPFCEWFVVFYCSWFALLVFVTLKLWLNDTAAYDRLCLMMFSGMTFCLIVYMIWPSALNLRPDPAALGRANPALWLLQLLWRADAAVNVCPSIHCQSTGCMALAFSCSAVARGKPRLQLLAWVWAALICLSTVFTKQHSVIDVALGLALVVPWYLALYCRRRDKARPA